MAPMAATTRISTGLKNLRASLRPSNSLTSQEGAHGSRAEVPRPLAPSQPLPQAIAERPGELLVQWSPGASAANREAIHNQLHTEVVSSLHTAAMKAVGSGVLEVVIDRGGNHDLSQLQDAFSRVPEVEFAEPNQRVSIQVTSTDPMLASEWGLQASGYGSKATTAWDKNQIGSTKVVTGVVDTGLDYTHKDLYLNVWLNQGEIRSLSFFSALKDTNSDGLITFRDLNNNINLSNSATRLSDWNGNGYIDAGDLLDNRSGWEDSIDNDSNGYLDDLIGWDFANNDNDPYDDNGHGTHVSGTIGAMGDNGIGVSGVNWQTQIMPLKFLAADGGGGLAGSIAAIDYYTTAKVQSTDRGESSRFIGTNNSWGGGGFSQSLANSIQRANDQGLLFIAAAGNGGSDGIGDNNDTLANYPSNYTNSNVIAVASITSTGSLSSFSNYGAVNVDLGAPGSSILSTLPGNNYGTLSGTSMATPHVSGALALMAAAAPQATGQQLKDALLQSTAATASLAGRSVTGGRLDVAAAISALTNTPTPTPTPNPTPNPVPPSNLVLWGTSKNDIITGGDGSDRITGVLSSGTSASALGAGQADVLTGGKGNDVFLLGDKRGIFYNDNNNANIGKNDYALIKDFNQNEDKLQLLKANYLTTLSSGSLSLYWDRNGNGRLDSSGSNQDELIAILSGASSLTSNNINWV